MAHLKLGLLFYKVREGGKEGGKEGDVFVGCRGPELVGGGYGGVRG